MSFDSASIARGRRSRARAKALALCAVAIAAPLRAQQSTSLATAPPGAETLQSTFMQVAEAVSPSVVALRIESRRKLVNPFEGFPFGDWFSPSGDHYQIQRGTGSGVVIRADGYVLTNKHVVEGASRLEVVFQDGRLLLGKSVGIDDATDLAVVKVQAKNLTTARFADSSRTRPGQWAIAIGSPFGLDYTVTVGVVSAVGRGGLGEGEIEDYLQTDASINPGNSGGPLVNLRGEVLGINTMIVGGGTGISFAIPSNLAQGVARQLIETGSVRRPYFGFGVQALTPDLAQHFGVAGRGGALINSITSGGPADKAGLEAGDVITSLDGTAVESNRELLRRLNERQVGAQIALGIMRHKKPLSLSLTAADRPGEKPARARGAKRPAGELHGTLGLTLAPLSPERAARLAEVGLTGALVSAVERGGNAERAGLARGDVIVEADRRAVREPADVDAALADGSAVLRVLRRNRATYVVLSREPE